MRRAVPGAVVVALCGALVSCTSAGGAMPTSGPLAVHPKPDAGMDALLQGVIRTDGECVRVEFDPDPANAAAADVVPSFPTGDASVDDGVLTWRGTDYVDGDAIALGGGFAAEPAGYLPVACEGLEVFIVSPF